MDNKINVFLLEKKYDFLKFVDIFKLYSDNDLSSNDLKSFENKVFDKDSIITIILAEVSNKIVWFMLLIDSYSTSHFKDILYLQDLYVDSSFRNNWVATKLFSYLEDYCKVNWIPRIDWSTHRENEIAQKFYKNYKVDNNWIYYKMNIKN